MGRIRPIGFDADSGIKIMLYGGPGTGKTSLWATFPGKILAVMCSGGMVPGEARTIDTEEYRAKVDEVTLENCDEMDELINYVKESEKYRTVVLDHCTGFQDLKLAEVLKLTSVPTQKSWGMATIQQYGAVSVQVKDKLRDLLGLRCNVVIVSQEKLWLPKEKEGEPTPRQSDVIRPFVGCAQQEGIAGWLNSSVDNVCQCFKRQKIEVVETVVGQGKAATTLRQEIPARGVDYCLRTGPSVEAVTKFRVPREKAEQLPEVIVNPTYEKLVMLIRGEPGGKGRPSLSPR